MSGRAEATFLRAINVLIKDILRFDDSAAHRDERIGPELRDIERMSRMTMPLSGAGKRALEVAVRKGD